MDVQLKVILGKDKGRLLKFGAGEYVIGRGIECQIRSDSPLISRQHCLLRIDESDIWLRDLGSANGTLVNDSLLRSERSLKHGDQVQLSGLVLEVLLPLNAMSQTVSDVGVLARTNPG